MRVFFPLVPIRKCGENINRRGVRGEWGKRSSALLLLAGLSTHRSLVPVVLKCRDSVVSKTRRP